jgi:glycosyltransferase involved in cell wall biosynthesis
MRICLLGDFSKDLDEGYKNIGHYMADELEKTDDVDRFNIKSPLNLSFWRKLYMSKPEIIHALSQPTYSTLLFLRFLKWICPNAKTVVSALRPENIIRGENDPTLALMRNIFRPDLILVQSQDLIGKFHMLGRKIAYLPNGVNLDKFCPPGTDQKTNLRMKYDLDPSRPVVLHVGHLIATRNLSAISDLPSKGIQVIVVGSTYIGIDSQVVNDLEKAGFIIVRGYQVQIDEYYKLADCYVFPLRPGDSLSMPLSVLEAMATNLPVVSTRFKGLESSFTEGDGLKFVDSFDKVSDEILEIIRSSAPVLTRNKVLSFSWSAIVMQLRDYYRLLLNADPSSG